jgi:hypothetical protein
MEALAAGHDAAVQMIDTSIVRVHQNGAASLTPITRIWVAHEAARRARFTRWWTPIPGRSISRSRPVRHTTIGCVRLSSTPCSHKRCYSRIVHTARTGLESLPARMGRGRTFRRNAIAKTLSASARICVASVSRAELDRTVLQQDQAMSVCRDPIRQTPRPTIWPSSNSHQSEFGCVLMSPRPSRLLKNPDG